MKYSMPIPISGPVGTPDNIIAVARRAEELGFDVLGASERLVMPRKIGSSYPYGAAGAVPGVGTTQNMMEMLTVLSFVAGQTSKIRLLTGALVLPYRNPLLAAKMLATIDVLSGGRLIIGCGVGWMREESESLGVPTAFEDRGAVSDEYIGAFKELWTSDNPTFEGKYISFSEIEFAPKVVQKPHPPLWIGGESSAAMRRTARFGDGWLPGVTNPRFPLDTPQQLVGRVDRLRRTVEDAGRDPYTIDIRLGGVVWKDEMETTAAGDRRPFTGAKEQVAEDIGRYEKIGVTYLSFQLGQPTLEETLEGMERFMTEVAPLVD